MPKITIDLPEEAYQNAMALSPAERERMIVNTFRTAKNEKPDFDRETNEADLEAIGRGIEDAKSGRVSSANDVLARLQNLPHASGGKPRTTAYPTILPEAPSEVLPTQSLF